MISKSKKLFPEFPSAAGVAIVVATELENVTKTPQVHGQGGEANSVSHLNSWGMIYGSSP